MDTATCKGLYTKSWKELYQAAIHEPDMNKMMERITEAESVLVIRMRELFNTSGDNFEEVESMDDALCILHALRSSLKHRPSAIQSPSSLDNSSTTLGRRHEA